MEPNFLADVQSFESKKLKSTDTKITTPSGKKVTYVSEPLWPNVSNGEVFLL